MSRRRILLAAFHHRRRGVLASLILPLLSFAPPVFSVPVEGMVQSREEPAIAGASVEVRRMAPRYQVARDELAGVAAKPPLVRVRTDQHGIFRFALPADGVFEIRVEHDGHVPMVYSPLATIGPRTLPVVRLRRDEGVTLRWLGPPSLTPGAATTDLFVIAKTSGSPRDSIAWGWRMAARRLKLDVDGRARLPRAAGEELDAAVFAPGSLALGRGQGMETIELRPATPVLMTKQARFQTLEQQPAADLVLVDPRWNLAIAVTGPRGSAPVWVPKRRVLARLEILHPEGGHWRQMLPLVPQAPVPMSVLSATGRRHGTVLSAAGTPIANALVIPRTDPGGWQRTDAQGRWSASSVGAAAEHWHVAAHGFAAQVLTAEPAAREFLPAIALQPVRDLVGKVADPAGRGLSSVVVTAHEAKGSGAAGSGRLVATAISDSHGRFALSGLSARSQYLVQLRHGQRAPLDLLAARPADLEHLVMPIRRPAFGQVVDLEEKPIVGARVAVLGAHGSRVEAISDEQGVWQLAYLPVGELTLEASAAEHAPFRVPGVTPPPGDQPADLGVLALASELILEGKVVDSQDHPIASAEIFWAAGDSDRRGLTSSDQQGAFRIAELGPGSVDLMVSAPGFLKEHRSGLLVAEVRSVVLSLTRAAVVSGRVLDSGGVSVAGADVVVRGRGPAPGRIEAADRAGSVYRETVARQDGRFEIGQLPPGVVEVAASAVGHQSSAAVAVELRPGERADPVTIELKPGVDVRGRVVTDTGRPLTAGRLSIHDVVGRIDAEGAFQLTGLAPGTAELNLWHEQLGQHTWAVELEFDMAELDLQVAEGIVIEGSVIDSDSLPVPGATVQILALERAAHQVDEQVTGDDGEFRAAALTAGRYRFLASHPDLGSASEELFLSEAIESDLVLELPVPALVSGKLLGLDSEELGAASVQAHHQTLGTVRGDVNHAGRYRIEPLAPGIWHLIAEVGQERRRAEARVMVNGEDLEQDISFEGFELSGQVRLLGEPLPARIHLRALERHGERRTKTDPEGSFRITDLAPGTYRVSAVARRQAVTFHRDLEIVGDQYVELDVDPASVDGWVTDFDGTPLVAASVRFEHRPTNGPAGSVLAFSTDTEGRFHVAQLAPGPYSLQIRHPGYESLQKLVDLEAAAKATLDLQLDSSPGLQLRVHLPNNAAIPARPAATIAVLGVTGEIERLEAQILDEQGEARFSTLPDGEWDLWVRVPGTIAQRQRTTVPGPMLDVELAAEAQVEIWVPQLAVREHRAEVRLQNDQGRPFATIDERGLWRQSWPVVSGQARIAGLPPGNYMIHVEAADGDRWQRQATLVLGTGNRYELSPAHAR